MRPKITALFLMITIFLGGMAGGVFLDRFYLEKSPFSRYKHFKKFMGPQRFDRIGERLQERFTKKLKLNSQQQDELKKILQQRMGVLKARSKEHDQEIESLKEETRRQIREILSPEQQKWFQEMVQGYKARKAK